MSFLYFDPAGLIISVPGQEQTQRVELRNLYTYGNESTYGNLETEEDAGEIARILALHETILDQRREIEGGGLELAGEQRPGGKSVLDGKRPADLCGQQPDLLL